MSDKGICLQTYIPVRAETSSGAEMVSSVLFGEAYEVLDEKNDFLHIRMEYDGYEGWISASSHAGFIPGFDTVCTHVYTEARAEHQIMFIPCGGMMPSSGRFTRENDNFVIERKLKNTDHLPLNIRLQKLALTFLNMPYLWGGRSFMGIDCSGLMQVVFKANDIVLPRDTSQQVHAGKAVSAADAGPCDLVFFSKPGMEKVVHVGMMLENGFVIHAGTTVRKDKLEADGIYINGKHSYRTVAYRKVIP